MTAPPREPTVVMTNEGVNVMRVTGGNIYDDVRAVWRAMYDAAPAPPVAQPAEPTRHPYGHLIVSDECVVCGASVLARCDSTLCPQFSTASIDAQQEQHHDDESNGRRTRWMAGESDEGHVQTGGGDGARGRDCPGEHGAGLLHSQQYADPRRGNATRAFPLLIDNEALRQQIAADPDDSEPSAGNAEPPATDDLVRQLRDADADPRSVVSWRDLVGEAAAELQRQAREISELRDGMLRQTRLNTEQIERAERAEAELDKALDANARFKKREKENAEREFVLEAERDALREVVKAADAMRRGEDCPMCNSGKLRNPAKEYWDTCAFANYDAARAKVKP